MIAQARIQALAEGADRLGHARTALIDGDHPGGEGDAAVVTAACRQQIGFLAGGGDGAQGAELAPDRAQLAADGDQAR